MNRVAMLLRQSADEVREYQRTNSGAKAFENAWIKSIVRRLEFASSLTDDEKIEIEIDAIAYSISDSGPLEESFSPSFYKALDALQRQRKKSAKR
jgi:hypothetical protein